MRKNEADWDRGLRVILGLALSVGQDRVRFGRVP